MIRRFWDRWANSAHQPDRVRQVDNWAGIIQDLIFPPTCILCGDQGGGSMDLCPPCRDSLPYLETGCRVCGLPTTGSADMTCGACLQTPPPYDRMIAVFRYEEPVRHLIQSLKFGSHHANARILGCLLADRVKANGSELPDVIIPVPLHTARYRERGFNQSLEIARVVSGLTGISVDYSLCRRTRHTGAQARLTAAERRGNVRNAFHIKAAPSHRHVAILDDVVTTSATVSELALALRRAGVGMIDIWACARALP